MAVGISFLAILLLVIFLDELLRWLDGIYPKLSIVGIILCIPVVWFFINLAWEIFIRSIRSAMEKKPCYYCPACGKEWSVDDLPGDKICPHDFVPLMRSVQTQDSHSPSV